MCSHVNHKAHAICNINCFFEIEGLLKVTGSYVQCDLCVLPISGL